MAVSGPFFFLVRSAEIGSDGRERSFQDRLQRASALNMRPGVVGVKMVLAYPLCVSNIYGMKRDDRLEVLLSAREREALRALTELNEASAAQVVRQLIVQAAAKAKRDAA